jgi:uncharacterized membrane protein
MPSVSGEGRGASPRNQLRWLMVVSAVVFGALAIITGRMDLNLAEQTAICVAVGVVVGGTLALIWRRQHRS